LQTAKGFGWYLQASYLCIRSLKNGILLKNAAVLCKILREKKQTTLQVYSGSVFLHPLFETTAS
jgi:hypothetical protein